MTGRRRRYEPGPLRPGVAGNIVNRLLVNPQELRPEWLRADGKEAVPFAVAGGNVDEDPVLEPGLAERTVLAALRLGADHLLACRTQPEYLSEPVAVVPQNPETLVQQAMRFGFTDFLVVPPGAAAALLVTTVGFGVAAGPASFVEAVLDADAGEARRLFAEQAFRSRDAEPALVETAYVFGCAASGRHHAPLWRAWSELAQAPPGSGVGEQVALMRQLAAGRIGAAGFVTDWLAARDREIDEGEHATGPLAEALRRVLYAVDDFVPAATLRGPEDLDEAGLVDAVRTATGPLHHR